MSGTATRRGTGPRTPLQITCNLDAMTDPSFLESTRVSYDALADRYAEASRDGLDGLPLDRGLLAAFAELVQADGAGPVADLGCGPGHVAAHLRGLGLNIYGVDLSPAMIAQARRAHPELRFAQGSMTAVDAPDGGLGGIVAWYSIIHIPTERLPALFTEFHRALKPGGYLLLAFQIGGEPLRPARALGRDVSLVFHRWPPGHVADVLRQAGFVEVARLTREPAGGTEKVPRAYILAQRPTPVSR